MADQSAKSAQEFSVPADAETELVGESLVEEVSIDGMCGVY
ncbi:MULTISPECIES: mycofactocin precursor MftA [unclassified Gordonia (in: high G+C Gram-positive bacteria)]|nr:mycofactocin precursor MftA [Gordonia sp. ABSL49_1]MCH5644690.1 mycofactocin precursor MftA [Gordonia sp. ABSL49_1]